jgi:hypothetical protein
MKKHYYNSLGEFYADVQNVNKCELFEEYIINDSPGWMGLSLIDIHKSKFSYPLGVEKLSHFKDFQVEKDITVKYWNQFDGYDIDVDRMMDNLDFLLDNHKRKSLPKTMDIYVNIGETNGVDYEEMLCKTYAAIKVIDRLESLGVRCAVYACNAFKTACHQSKNEELGYLEICIKQHADALNLGALCTAISPWIFRYWFLLYTIGRYPDLTPGISRRAPMPADLKGMIIESGSCLTTQTANKFIESIKL